MAVETDYNALVFRLNDLAEEFVKLKLEVERRLLTEKREGLDQRLKRYADAFRAALASASVKGEVRPFHDGRHTSITNAAAAGVGPGALQARAGHSDLSTTQRYIDLAGVLFRDEADVAEARMFGIVTPVEEDG